jgi:hypothetical protein
MEIALTAESASRIRAVLGDAVDLSPAAVPEVLAQLASNAPDVYSEVLSQLSGSDIRLDSERALHRRHRRLALRRALFGWGEYESDAGDRLLAKRRVAAAVPLALAIILLALAGLSALLNASRRMATPAAAHVRRPSAIAPARTPAIRPRALRVAATQTVPVTPPEAARGGSLVPLPPVPALAIPPSPSGVTAVAHPSSIVFSRLPVEADASASADQAPRSPIVYARDLGADTGDAPGQHAVASGGAGGTQAGVSRRVGDRIAARLMTGIIVAAGVPPVPVIVESTDESTWLGYAHAEPDGRVHISFEAAGRSGAGSFAAPPATFGTTTNGVALEPDHLTAGLPGRVVVRRRAAAAVAIGAIVQAVADYMQAVAHAGQVTVAEGATQVSIGGPAPGWTYVASRLAEALNPQASGNTIETLEVPAGTRCFILITAAP